MFLENYTGETLEEMTRRVNEELSDRSNIIEQEYGADCFRYDPPEIFGEDTKKTFEDRFLKQTPVAHLRMILG